MKMVWNENFIKNMLASFDNVSRAVIQIHVRNEQSLNTVMQYNADNNEILFSPKICNDELLPDFVVISALAFVYSAIKLELQSFNNILQVRSYAANLCNDIGSKYIDEDECEEYIRPVRRIHFPDSLNGGCYFKVGDLIRERPGSGFAPKCTITAISPLTESGIMISYKLHKSKIIHILEEKELYQNYIIAYETGVKS